MPRPKNLTIEERAAIEQATIESINGTIIPGDQPLIGKSEVVEHFQARDVPVEKTQLYAAVNTLFAQPFVVSVGSYRGTMASSADNYWDHQRRELIKQERKKRPRDEFGQFKPR